MFIGHYGPAFAAKTAAKPVPLWAFFIAAQWLDVCWSALVMLGIEKVRIVPGFTSASPLDLYFMPYTHGLAGALALSALFGLLALPFVRVKRWKAWAALAAAAFSHWVLDLIVHRPDLPLVADTMKVGFGLWRWVWISLPLELLVMIAGAWIFARGVPSSTRQGDWALWLFVALMAAIELYAAFGPAPASPVAEAQTALAAYLGLGLAAGIIDWARGASRG